MSFAERTLIFLLMFVLVGLVTFGGTSIILSAHADGKIDYCRAELDPRTGSYALSGHRKWRGDAMLSSHSTISDAIETAKKINCELH